jgi:hypothetical protein
MAANTLELRLLESRLLSPVQISIAQRDADMRRRKLAPTLIDLGLIDEERFANWIVETTGLRLLHPLPDETVARLADRVPAVLARDQEAVPVGADGDELMIAMINPFDEVAIDRFNTATGLKIRPVVARHGEVTRLLNKFYPADPAASPDPPPFEFGSETLLFSQKQPLSIGDASPGSRTQIFTPRPDVSESSSPVAAAPSSPLDRIELQLAALTRTVESMERKLAAIDAALARVLSR